MRQAEIESRKGVRRHITGVVGTWLRMIRFSHTVFALPFAVMAAVVAGREDWTRFGEKILLILGCMVTARSVAMTFNRLADARIDARNPRTAGREIPTGKISQRAAWAFLLMCAALFMGLTALFRWPLGPWFGFGNIYPLALGPPTLLFICGYSLSKRFTWACHFWLGASLMLAPLGAWVAVRGGEGPIISRPPLLLGGAVLLWTAGFDMLYALQDVAVDRRDGLLSIPARWGVHGALWMSRLSHLGALALLALFGISACLGILYWIGWLLAAGLIAWEHRLMRRGRTERLALAFGTINGVMSVLLGAAVVLDVTVSG